VTAQPDSPEANLGAGLSLFASGDKAKFQEAANYLQHFVDVAPDTILQADAKAILAELKSTEKVVPEEPLPGANALRKRRVDHLKAALWHYRLARPFDSSDRQQILE